MISNALIQISLLQRELTKHVVGRGICLVIFPGILYLLQFFVMLTILHKSGPHDDMMSSAFQASLEVLCYSITSQQQAEIILLWVSYFFFVIPVAFSRGRVSRGVMSTYYNAEKPVRFSLHYYIIYL